MAHQAADPDSVLDTAVTWASALWDVLTAPSPDLRDPEARRRARLLAALMILLMPLGIATVLLQALTSTRFSALAPMVLASVGGAGAAYVLSRTRYYWLGAFIVTTIPSLTAFLIQLIPPGNDHGFSFMVISLLLGIMLLSNRWVLVLSLANVLVTLLLFVTLRASSPPVTASRLSFIVITTALILALMRYRDRLERSRQRELATSAQRYRNLFDRVPVGLYRISPQGEIIDANPAMVDMLGYPTRGILLSACIPSLLASDEDASGTTGRLRGATGVWDFERQLDRYDGFRIWVQGTNREVYDVEGRLQYYEGALQEVTDRKKAQQAETEQRQLAETLRDVTLSLTSHTDPKVVLAEIVQQARQLVPYTTANLALCEGEMLRIAHVEGYPEEVQAKLSTPERRWDSLPIDKQAILTRRPVVISDTENAPEWQHLSQTTWKSYVSVPIMLHDYVLGLLRLNGDRPNQFSSKDCERLEPLASAAAIALGNAQLYEATRERAVQLELVAHTGRQTAAILNLDELLQSTVELIAATFGYYNCSVALVQRGYIELKATSSPALQGRVGSQRRPAGQGIIDWVAQTGEILLAPDVIQEPRFTLLQEAPDTRSELAVPIKLKEEVIGVLDVQSARRYALSERDIDTLQPIADQLAIAIRNAELYQTLEAHNEFLERAVAERTADLQREKERAEAILASAADAMVIIDAQGRVVSVNPAFETMTGYRAAEAVGRHFDELAEAGALPATQRDLETAAAAMDAGHTWRGELLIRAKDGRLWETDLHMAPLRQGNGTHGYVVTMRDISPFKEVQRLKDAFVSNVSHELRTPIANIKLHHRLLEVKPEGREIYMARLQRETDRLARIIEDLLYLSRLDQDRAQFKRAAVDLNKLIEQYAADRVPLAISRGISLTHRVTPHLPRVQADEGMLGQVLSILLTNALTYTTPGGNVTLSTCLRTENGARWSGFCVSDDGPGIAPQEQAHLFERFFRGAAGRASGAPGTGLGLAIAREIVMRHQGAIEVHSDGTPGRGATFSVWLPCAP